jgi:hypothetical protein
MPEIIDQANELAERRLEAAMRNAHQPCGSFGYSLPRLRGRDTRAAPELVAGCQRCADCKKKRKRGKHQR